MSTPTLPTDSAKALPEGWPGIVTDWSGDRETFKVPWGKAMMWIFLLSDTFVFSSFLIGYMTVRMSTTVPWPDPSKVFGLSVGGVEVPLLLIAIMTFVLISSSGTMAMAVNFGYRRNARPAAALSERERRSLWSGGRTPAGLWTSCMTSLPVAGGSALCIPPASAAWHRSRCLR